MAAHRHTGRRRIALIGAWLFAVIALVLAALALLPMPNLELWALGMLVTEFSLVLAALAVLGAGAAVLARKWGAAWSAGVVALVNAMLLVAGLLPPVSAWATTRELDVPLSLSPYFDGLSSTAARGPDATVRYARIGGTDLMLDVWRPPRPASAPAPAVINIHGGTQQAGQSLFPRWDAWLADSGYVVFDISYRFFRSHDWRRTPGDVKCALGWVARNAGRYGADPDRIVMMGQSAGGYLALLAAYTTAAELPPTCPAPEPDIAAVVAWYPPADMTKPMTPSFRLAEPLRRQLTEEGPLLSPEEAERVSPLTYLRRGLPPTLLVQGGRDFLQPAADTRAFAGRLAAAGVEHRLVEIPYADHQFDLSWGGFGSQITRHVTERFLREVR
ncbi:alpha/beta hydrolase [Nonomuraea turkmeniaca]|uniref:Alpha/beta hydrolase n=1 Tax=Nonomuraea turkmeniaca TaxID=103838 RepID=A0A5S4FGD9_9ACTN|nr:alpha/beta hydrolase [Nonomuraea turkmeniaca]TMR17518.1 alpha/beta hydrolase [Nonomuraea turkmeniaca]